MQNHCWEPTSNSGIFCHHIYVDELHGVTVKWLVSRYILIRFSTSQISSSVALLPYLKTITRTAIKQLALGMSLSLPTFLFDDEVSFADQAIEVLGAVNLLQVYGQKQLLLLRSSPNFINVVMSFLFTLFSMCTFMMGSFILYLRNRNDNKKPLS